MYVCVCVSYVLTGWLPLRPFFKGDSWCAHCTRAVNVEGTTAFFEQLQRRSEILLKIPYQMY